LETSEIIVLRATPIKEADLIVSGLSPDFGKLELVAYRARKTGDREFPVLDVFRKLQVGFEPPKSEGTLAVLKEASPLEIYENLPRKIENLEFASGMGRFLTLNTVENSPLPMVFDVFGNVLRALSGQVAWTNAQSGMLFKLAFLYENGMLPDVSTLPPAEQTRLERVYDALMECALSGEPVPASLPEEYQSQLSRYLSGVIVAAGLRWK